ncbi:hypothetical protein BpHYR1_013131 [Brachionus plicatilis]|uniref:Uncharacterized protein n=1 Tax=Brachionus plicatilis TaxID=10195 RepID=A0A3M7Q9I8_BRAPC|nr:hypothetical protein BpHYR1_013131 [Brachionus plicatilis]
MDPVYDQSIDWVDYLLAVAEHVVCVVEAVLELGYIAKVYVHSDAVWRLEKLVLPIYFEQRVIYQAECVILGTLLVEYGIGLGQRGNR